MTRAGRPLRRWVPMFVALALAVLSGPAATLAGPAAAQSPGANSSGPQFLKLTLDSVGPETVTTTSDSVLTVSGTVTNVGDRPVSDVSVRIQRAAPVATGIGLRSSLRLDQVNYDVVGPFQDLADRLEPAQRKQFTIRVGVRAGTHGISGSSPVTSSLDITEPGVYPLLLNVNGQPDYGSQARLDDARFLLPVLGLPAASDAKDDAGQPVPAPTEAPMAITTIWPLADRPRLVGGITGPLPGKALLTDDELAGELATGGRLDQLVAALESVRRPESGRSGPNLASSICLAVDPDLLLTVSAMAQGYRVLASPSDPGGPTRDGSDRGPAAAKAWLDRVRAVASGMCTIALPFAQVDLPALAAVHDADLSARAIDAPADIVDSQLSVKSVRGVALPDSGSIDSEAGTLLAGHGFHTAVLADTAVSTAESRSNATGVARTVRNTAVMAAESDSPAPDMVRLPAILPPAQPNTQPPAEPGLKAATFDIWSATALAAVGSNPPTPPFTPERVRYKLANDSRAARLQDALGAVSWAALNPQAGGPRSLLLMPPQQWSANKDEASALLNQLELLVRNGLATPRSFADLLATPPDPRPFDVDYLRGVAELAVPDQFIDPLRAQDKRITDLFSALAEVPQQEPSPRQYLTPLRDDLVRVLTLSDRNSPDGQADTVAQRRLDQTTRTLDTLFREVTVLPPGGVYTLASEKSPLLLVVRNPLPVAIRIKFRIDAPTETKITDIGEQILPAEGTRSFQIPTEVIDSRNLTIPISITTPDGVALGNGVSVSVRSNAYGQALAIITACAGALLLLLAGRRLWRRFRGQPDPADEGLDTGTRRRVNRYLRARLRVLQRQEEP
ncbi:DUF6049 family protein [Nocardia pseudobrasiliensis]|uniref:Glycoprotein n=1 Tax=Nocardia pseudobrasiliensis TaxID=45979 RepID=A0A370HX48_9NOCA|nr:DUF6049 family protein [Nocardia pseudobrasiliensis]RDI61534.1 hypothetical protein DFR76_11332 [Nocardia pseudobrasiliensis]